MFGKKLFGMESPKQPMNESLKDVDLIMLQLNATILEKNAHAITYEIDEDISGAALFKQISAEHPDLTIESKDGMYGKYEVTVSLRQAAEQAVTKEEETV